jgi:hypothetical protein
MTYTPKIALLPGAKLTPEVLLARTADKLSRIKAVTVIIQWDDDTVACDWSSMKTSELCMAKDVLALNVQAVLEGNYDGL